MYIVTRFCREFYRIKKMMAGLTKSSPLRQIDGLKIFREKLQRAAGAKKRC